jgi:hypothetical protein
MEFKIRRFTELLAIFLTVTSLIVIFDDVSPPRYALYKTTNEYFETPFRNQFTLTKNFDFSLVLKQCQTPLNKDCDLLQFETVESNQSQYHNTQIGDTFWLFYTPFYHRKHAAIEYRDQNKSIFNPAKWVSENRFSQALIIALLMVILSILSYKSQQFEIKVTLIVFDIVLAIVQNWLII